MMWVWPWDADCILFFLQVLRKGVPEEEVYELLVEAHKVFGSRKVDRCLRKIGRMLDL